MDLHDIGKYHMMGPETSLSSSGDRAMSALGSLVGPEQPHLGPPPTPALFKLSLGALSSCLSCVGGLLVSSLAMPLPVCSVCRSGPQSAGWSPDLTSVLLLPWVYLAAPRLGLSPDGLTY